MRHKKKVIVISLIFLFLVLAFVLFSTKEKQEETPESEKIYCKVEQRNIDVCIALYEPVCGWSDSGVIKTYSNSCFACIDENVEYYLGGECK